MLNISVAAVMRTLQGSDSYYARGCNCTVIKKYRYKIMLRAPAAITDVTRVVSCVP